MFSLYKYPASSKPTVWDGDCSSCVANYSVDKCSKPTVWDGDVLIPLALTKDEAVLSPPCGMVTPNALAMSLATEGVLSPPCGMVT